MSYKWIKTSYVGVRYRENKDRRYNNRADRYFTIRYQKDGKTKDEALGWSSQGWSADKANARLAELKEAARTGRGATSLREQREIAKREAQRKKELEDKQRQLEVTFGEFFHHTYFPQCQIDKAAQTSATEELIFRNWLEPVIGNLFFSDISIDHLDKIKQNMLAGKRPDAKRHGRDRNDSAKDANLRRNPAKPMSARSINYALAIIRQVWNRACSSNPPIAFGEWPGASKAFKKPKADNKRKRYLTHNEASALFQTLQSKSQEVHDMSLLSLHCGMRAGEIFKLSWDKVNLKDKTLLLIDTKNGDSRTAFLTDPAIEILRRRAINPRHQRLVFISSNGKPYKQVPSTFAKTVKELGFNSDVNDTRDKVVFHTLRHTYASWMNDNGASLPTIRDLLGHKNLIMTSRYTHVSAEAQRQAAEKLNSSITPAADNVIPITNASKIAHNN